MAWLAIQRELARLRRENRQLKQELANMQAQNTSMREGMRRCVSCEYRLAYKHTNNSS